MIDTHAHIFAKEFDEDIEEVVQRAKDIGIEKILLPNIDLDSYPRMMKIVEKYPNYCLPIAGIHPCDIKGDYRKLLDKAYNWLKNGEFIAVGETGIDLYWDKTFLEEQKIAFAKHLQWGKEFNLPVVVHIRDSFNEIFEVVEQEADPTLFGVFHCFTGTVEQAERAIALGFKIGVGGVVTFKNAGVDKTIKEIDMKHLVIETDSPYLAPTPFRGKRNEPSYVQKVVEKIADIKMISNTEVDEITTQNAKKLFNL